MKHLTIPCLQRAAVLLIMFAFLKAANAQVQTPKYVTTAINSHGYYEYLPPGYNTSGQNYPLMIFIHGIGELGDGSQYQLPKVLVNGPPKLISQGTWPATFKVRGQNFSFIVISPQFTYWPGGNDVQSVIDYCVSHYRIDQSRIYVTGLSMGGGVTWDYASMSTTAASRVAAIVPVCGASDGNLTKGKIIAGAGLPVWALQNKDDNMVSVQNTIDWFNSINAPSAPVANPPMKETIFPAVGKGHDAWDQAYDPNYRENGMNVYEWMLQYSRGNDNNNSPGKSTVVASAGSNQTITLPVNQVKLDGSGSTQDKHTNIQWSKISGPSSYAFNDATAVSPTVTNLVAGTYVFRITVSNNKSDNKTATDDVTVTVNPVPAPSPGPTTGPTYSTWYTDLPGTVEAENFSAMSGVQTEGTTDAGGGQDVGYIDSGDWMEYSITTSQAGNYTVNFRVASPASHAQFQVRTTDGTVLQTINVPNTGGFQNWQTISASINLSKGTQKIRLVSTSPIWNNWNINWLDINTNSTLSTPPATSLHIEAENYVSMSGVETENTSDAGGGKDVDYIDPWDWMMYSVNVPQSGNYTISFRIASPNSNSRLQLQNGNGNTLANVNLPNTYGFQNWNTVSVNVYLQQGQQTLKVLSSSSAWNYWNFNWMDISPAGNTGSRTSSMLATDRTDITETTTGLSLYPNPATDHIMVNINNEITGKVRLQVLNMSGAVQMDMSFDKPTKGNMQTYLLLQRMQPGTYILKVTMDNWSQSLKLMKQ